MKNNFWDKRSKKYEQGLIDNPMLVSKTLEACKAYLKKTDNVLDFGCATGEYSLALANQVDSIIGIDTSKNMIEIAQQKLSQKQLRNVSFQVADITEARINNKKYSAILALSVLHLTNDIADSLKKLYGLLDKNGCVISVTPCLSNRSLFMRVLMNLLQKIGIAPTIQSVSYDQLRGLFEVNGFSIVESKILDSKNALYWIVGEVNDQAHNAEF
ncbi:MAG TPA: hypothetical protein DCS93_37235 [Microscillaceae bacterium]|nr:hypothetical protein [Microscillaceae bacterium]